MDDFSQFKSTVAINCPGVRALSERNANSRGSTVVVAGPNRLVGEENFSHQCTFRTGRRWVGEDKNVDISSNGVQGKKQRTQEILSQ